MFQKKRIELKYIIDFNTYSEIEKFSLKHGQLDPYTTETGTYNVNSIYKYVWNDKINNIKGKIRLREYNNKKGSDFYIEEKVKKNFCAYKNRSRITKEKFLIFKNTNNILDIYNDKDCDNLVNFKNFEPVNKNKTFLISYSRRPFIIEMNNIKFRLTIDSNLLYNNSTLLLPKHNYILEVKGYEDMYYVKNQLFEYFNIQPTKISKYKLAKKEYDLINKMT